MATPPDRLTIETVRLLLYVAWADNEIAPEEYDYLLRMTRNAGMSEADVMSLDAALRDREKLHQPDIAALNPHREEVLAKVRELIKADHHIAPEEDEILYKLASALSD